MEHVLIAFERKVRSMIAQVVLDFQIKSISKELELKYSTVVKVIIKNNYLL